MPKRLPTDEAMRAARAIVNDLLGEHGDRSDRLTLKYARIIDRELDLPDLLNTSKWALNAKRNAGG